MSDLGFLSHYLDFLSYNQYFFYFITIFISQTFCFLSHNYDLTREYLFTYNSVYFSSDETQQMTLQVFNFLLLLFLLNWH